MKFSIRSDVLKKVFQNFLIEYPIILSYQNNQFSINQIVGEETLITFRTNDDCIKLPKRKKSFSIEIPSQPFIGIIGKNLCDTNIVFSIKNDVRIKLSKKLSLEYKLKDYQLPCPDFSLDHIFTTNSEFIDIIKYCTPDTIINFVVDSTLKITIRNEDFTCVYEIETDILDTFSSSFLQKHLYEVLKLFEQEKPINLNLLENHPMYVTQEKQHGILEIFIAPFIE
jgi:hypothetical protein